MQRLRLRLGWQHRTLGIRQSIGVATTCLLLTIFAAASAEGANRPLVLVVDGGDWWTTVTFQNPIAKTGYVALALQRSASLDLEIKSYAWSGSLWQTRAAVDDLKRNLQQTIEVARNDRRPLMIVAHSWGGILSYVALRELDTAQKLRAGDVDLLLTIHSPLGMKAPDPRFATVAFADQQAVYALVRRFVPEKAVGIRTGGWKNYWSRTDWLSGPITSAKNVETNTGHTEAYTDARLVSSYLADLAAAARSEDSEQVVKSGAAIATELTFRMKDGSSVSGQLKEESIKVKSSIGTATVPVKDIVSFSAGELRLKDGNVLKGELAASSLAVASKYGTLQLNAKDIAWLGVGTPAAVAAAAAPAAVPAPQASPAKPPGAASAPAPTPAAPAPGPTTPGSSVAGLPLPKHYGVYLVSQGRLYELRKEQAETRGMKLHERSGSRFVHACCSTEPVSVSDSEVRFVVFERSLGNLSVDLRQFQYVRRLRVLDGLGADEGLKGPFKLGVEDSTQTLGLWMLDPQFSYKFRVAPVPGQPDMLLIELHGKLAPGIYGLQVESAPGFQFPLAGVAAFKVNYSSQLEATSCEDWVFEVWPFHPAKNHKLLRHPCTANAVPDAAVARGGGKSSGGQTATSSPSTPRSPGRTAALPPAGSQAGQSTKVRFVNDSQQPIRLQITGNSKVQVGGSGWVTIHPGKSDEFPVTVGQQKLRVEQIKTAGFLIIGKGARFDKTVEIFPDAYIRITSEDFK